MSPSYIESPAPTIALAVYQATGEHGQARIESEVRTAMQQTATRLVVERAAAEGREGER